uniref:Ovule protein n=1 Tax=Gongylonema pulchrum TaxID=637853 RepID=A0A183DBH0_9BILA
LRLMSYSSPLSSCSTPGWNDPPPVLGGSAKIASPSPGVATGALANRHRRPVHPAIQVILLIQHLSSILPVNP